MDRRQRPHVARNERRYQPLVERHGLAKGLTDAYDSGSERGPRKERRRAFVVESIEIRNQHERCMARNWNKIWRNLHLTLGLVLVAYHARIAWYHNGFVDSVWSADIDKFVSTTFIFFVMWTGLAKWPIYPWYKKRQNRKKREAKAAAATE